MKSTAKAALLVGLLGIVPGCGDALVGGACAEGYVANGSRCVKPDGDSAFDPPSSGGSGGEGAGGSGGFSSSSGSTGGDGAGGSSSSTEGAGGSVLGTGGAGPATSTGTGVTCFAPLASCGGTCANLSNDAANCGGCGVVCAPGEGCDKGVCGGPTGAGSGEGQTIVIGMNYANVKLGDPEAVLLGNALFMAAHEPVRLLEYAEHAEPNAPSVDNVHDLIGDEAFIRDRTVEGWALSSSADLGSSLATGAFDVLLVHDQSAAKPGELATIGQGWRQALSGFTSNGGVVIVLASASGRNEMSAFLRAALELPANRLENISGYGVVNARPSDPLGTGVLAAFASTLATAAIPISGDENPDVSFVLVDSTSAGVALRIAP